MTNVTLSVVQNGLVRIAVAYTNRPGEVFEKAGKKFEISKQDLADMQRNLARREVMMDYDHLSAGPHLMPMQAKAAGWIRRPGQIEPFEGDRFILWAWAEPTAVCAALVKQKEYRYFSPEIHWKEKSETADELGTVLAAGAMTNRPFLKDLPPIELADADYNELFGFAANAGTRAGQTLPLLASVALSENGILFDTYQGGTPPKEKKVMAKKIRMSKGSKKLEVLDDAGSAVLDVDLDDDASLDDASLDELSASCDEMLSKRGRPRGLKASEAFLSDIGAPGKTLAEVRTMVERSARGAAAGNPKDETALLSETVGTAGRLDVAKLDALEDAGSIGRKASRRAEQADARVHEAFKAGKLTPAEIATGAPFRMALSDSAGFKALIEDRSGRVALAPTSAAASSTGNTGADFLALVNARETEKKIPYHEALSEVSRENPELYDQYTKWVRKGEAGQ